MNKLRLHGNTCWQVCPLGSLQRHVGIGVYTQLESIPKTGVENQPWIQERNDREREEGGSLFQTHHVHVEKDVITTKHVKNL